MAAHYIHSQTSHTYAIDVLMKEHSNRAWFLKRHCDATTDRILLEDDLSSALWLAERTPRISFTYTQTSRKCDSVKSFLD